MKTNQDHLFFPSVTPFWEDFLGRNGIEKGRLRSAASMPAVNIEEKPHAFEIALAAPGLQRDDFEIKIDNGVLTISSEKEEQHEEHDPETKYTRREFNYRSFNRSFTLPETIEEDSIEAAYQDGILLIRLPKKVTNQKQPVKQIMIK